MTIKWVKSDPLVMNGEPFCYGSRLTVRQLLEERRHGYDLTRILTDHPELKWLGVASAWAYAAEHPERYVEFLAADGSLVGSRVQRRRGGGPPRAPADPGGRRRPGCGAGLTEAAAAGRPRSTGSTSEDPLPVIPDLDGRI